LILTGNHSATKPCPQAIKMLFIHAQES
jgi:hypothetical protein